MNHRSLIANAARQCGFPRRILGAALAGAVLLAGCSTGGPVEDDTYFTEEAMRKLSFVDATVVQARPVKIRPSDEAWHASRTAVELTLAVSAAAGNASASPERRFIVVQRSEPRAFYAGQPVRLVSSLGRYRVIPAADAPLPFADSATAQPAPSASAPAPAAPPVPVPAR